MENREYRGYAPVADSNFMYRVYGWMAFALTISAVTAYAVAISPTILKFVYYNPAVTFFLIIGQLALVVAISSSLRTGLRAGTVMALFLLYSFLTGLTLSSIFFRYTFESIYSSFFVAAAMFGAMCLYGYFTKSDLSSLGNLLFMGLIGLIISIFINMLLQSSMLEHVISVIGVFIYTALTAYDTQRIKRISEQFALDREMKGKIAIVGALTLYLDFLNLFLFILRMMNGRRS